MKFLLKISVAIVFFASCKKTDNHCNESTGSSFGFKIYESVLDSFFLTDTSFANRNITFQANADYKNISWKIGRDTRNFSSSSVSLYFYNPEVITVKLDGLDIDRTCNIVQTSSKRPFVLITDDGSVISPLVGFYQGYNTEKPTDTFTVAIKFWFGSRYPWWNNGAYSVENLPKGYSNTTQNWNGYSRPEIQGIIASNGYSNIGINMSGNLPAEGIKGYGSLKRGYKDTLIFKYSIIDTAKFSQLGQLSYLQKTFKGIKK